MRHCRCGGVLKRVVRAATWGAFEVFVCEECGQEVPFAKVLERETDIRLQAFPLKKVTPYVWALQREGQLIVVRDTEDSGGLLVVLLP